jgi:uncharacterized protein YaeQ
MLPSAPLQLRISLAHVDRGLERVQKLIVGRDPDTTPEELLLRVLAYCLFFEEGLRISEGPSRHGVPDLSVTKLDGKVAVWIACGAADVEDIRHAVAHNQGVIVHALFDDPERRDAFLRQIARLKRRPPGFEEISIWTIAREPAATLAARPELRQRWAVTVVTDHIYIDADGVKVDSEITRLPPPPFEDER